MLARILILFLCVSPLGAAPIDFLPPELRGAVQPQVTVAPSGRIHIVVGKDNAIYHTSSPDGRLFSAPEKIGELPKLALRMRRGPRVTATDQSVLVTAISHADGNIHSWSSTDTGRTWSEGAPLNTVGKSAREGLQALAGDGRGSVAAVWLDLRSGGMELWSRTSPDAGVTWNPEVRVYASPDGHICECCVPSVAFGPGGAIATMWRNWLAGSRDLWTALSTDGGRTFSSARKLGEGSWKLPGCPMDGGGLAFGAHVEVLTAWRREGAVFRTTASGAETLLGTGAQPLVIGGPRPTILWEQNGALYAQRGDEPASVLARPARMASGARTKSGIALAWEEGDAVSAKLKFAEFPD